MDILTDIILRAGRSAVELALFVLLPVMVVMLSLMRLLEAKGVLDVINRAGAEAFKIAVGAIPMLVLALVAVMALRTSGVIDGLTRILAPLLTAISIDPALILPTLTKYIGGGTAMMGVMDEMLREGTASIGMLNRSAGFLIHPLDVPGVAVLISFQFLLIGRLQRRLPAR